MDTWKKHYASPTCNTPQNLAFYYQQNQKVNVRQKEEARNEALDRDGERRPGKRTAASHGQLCIWRIECKIFMLFAYEFQIRRPKRIHKTSKVMEDQKKKPSTDIATRRDARPYAMRNQENVAKTAKQRKGKRWWKQWRQRLQSYTCWLGDNQEPEDKRDIQDSEDMNNKYETLSD